MFMGTGKYFFFNQPPANYDGTTRQELSSSVNQSKSYRDEEDSNLLSTSQSILTRKATGTDNKDPVVLLSQKAKVIKWVFDVL